MKPIKDFHIPDPDDVVMPPSHECCICGKYDLLRAKSMEELAEFLSGIVECNRGCKLDCGDSCIGAWLDWLKETTNV